MDAISLLESAVNGMLVGLMYSLVAIGIVLMLFVMRIRSHRVKVTKARTADVYNQVERLRAARKSRLERKIR